MSTHTDANSRSDPRATKYPRLECGITLGTVCEYEVDDWSWVVVTDLPEKTWGTSSTRTTRRSYGS